MFSSESASDTLIQYLPNTEHNTRKEERTKSWLANSKQEANISNGVHAAKQNSILIKRAINEGNKFAAS